MPIYKNQVFYQSVSMALCQTFRITKWSLISVSRTFVARNVAAATSLPTKSATSPKKRPSTGPENNELLERAVLLANTFNITPKEMQDYLKSNTSIVSMKKEKFEDIATLIKSCKFTAEDVLKYPRLFHLSVPNTKRRITELESRGLAVKVSVITLSENKYKSRLSNLITEQEVTQEYNHHENLLTHILHCTAEKAELIMREHSWLRNSKISTLGEGIKIVQSFGVSNDAILQRIHAAIISPAELQRQLSILKENGIHFSDYPETYVSLLHPRDRYFRKSLQRVLDERKILQEGNCTNKEEYILYRLNCTSADLGIMLRIFSLLLSIRLPKLKQNLDVLLNECCFTSRDIIYNPQILSFASSTLKERCDALNALNIDITVTLMKMTHMKFHNFIEKMKPAE